MISDEKRLAEAGDGAGSEKLRWRIGSCRRLLAAITGYGEARLSGDKSELRKAVKALRKAFAQKAFDAEIVLPNLITMVFD